MILQTSPDMQTLTKTRKELAMPVPQPFRS